MHELVYAPRPFLVSRVIEAFAASCRAPVASRGMRKRAVIRVVYGS